MFEKQELQTKDAAELVEIARSLNIAPETISSPEEAIDRILSAQEGSEVPQKRTRKRILKKDVPDHVYSVNGIDGKNLDTKAAKRRAKASTTAGSSASPAMLPPSAPVWQRRWRQCSSFREPKASVPLCPTAA